MSNRPHVRKVGTWWRVYVNERMFYTGKRHTDAWERAEHVANYARERQFNHDLDRIAAALRRMESR